MILNEDSAVWGMISDKFLTIPVKFSKEAVAAYEKLVIQVIATPANSGSRKFGRRLTETRTALVTIKQFKPISTRVPVRKGNMSAETRLALHCEEVSVIGSSGENQWGHPKDLDSDVDLREWVHGLSCPSNVLKDRKKAREGNHADPPVAKNRVVSPPKPAAKPTARARTRRTRDPMELYQKEWKVCSNDLLRLLLNSWAQETLQNPQAFIRPVLPLRLRSESAELGNPSFSVCWQIVYDLVRRCTRLGLLFSIGEIFGCLVLLAHQRLGVAYARQIEPGEEPGGFDSNLTITEAVLVFDGTDTSTEATAITRSVSSHRSQSGAPSRTTACWTRACSNPGAGFGYIAVTTIPALAALATLSFGGVVTTADVITSIATVS
ncbi:hypothetical protein C8R43DRAFT_1023510 [Mycena crocata]|nr:hypothetical protein C8R43DRAFT_1023510 [Mycena crocata]